MDQRLLSNSVDIFAPIKSQKLKTFNDQVKPPKKSAAGKEVILRADKKLFSRLLILGQSRKVDEGNYVIFLGNCVLSISKC